MDTDNSNRKRILSLRLFCLSVYLHSVDSRNSWSFQHELLEGLRTQISRMTRMSPLGSAACVSCVRGLIKKNSFDSLDSCSFQHELLEGLQTRISRMTRILSLRLFCLSVYLHSVGSRNSCSFKKPKSSWSFSSSKDQRS